VTARASHGAGEGGPGREPAVESAPSERPTAPLRLSDLFQISVFWFALNAIWGGFEIFQQKRTVQLVGEADAPLALGMMDLVAAPLAMLVMPVMGSVSDYTRTRWGRRKPFILFGSLTAGVALGGLALAPSLPVLILFFLLLQVTANVARGPFAGLVPDLVPERQVGTASGLMGLMIVLGLIGGYLIIWSGYLLDEDFTLPAIALGILVAATGLGTFLWVPNGPPPKPREGRSWPTIALETFGTDILQQRSYLYLLGSRFFILMAGGFFMNLNILFLERALDVRGDEQATWILVGLAISSVSTGLGTLPGARISDRIGRKPVIYGAAAIGAAGMSTIALAPSAEVVMGGLALLGVGQGAFLSVDWALMTDIIPKASAGRYMGLSNIVEAANGAIASSLGGAVMYATGTAIGMEASARLTMSLAVVAFLVGAALLVPVREPRRARGAAPPPAGAPAA
jgi:MFS family permease